MVALSVVHASNAQLRGLGPGLVALFVGGTSGIGEYTAKDFIRNTSSPHVYIVGRSVSAADRIIEECEALNKDGKVEFLEADVSELKEVDRVCNEIMKKEKHINLLVQSQGNLNLRGRDESPEGLDRKFTLNFYSRMRFISNLLPFLRTASAISPNFSRSVSILGAGHEGRIDLDDLELKSTFSGAKCAAHTTVMNDFMTEEFASREPGTTFIHSFPGHLTTTGISRELPTWARALIKIITPPLKPFMVRAEEIGARQLFIATIGIYPPANPLEGALLAVGVAVPNGLGAIKGGNGRVGSGGYILNWNCEVTGDENLLSDYGSKGVTKLVWNHTMDIFDRVEKISQATEELVQRPRISSGMGTQGI